jgi:hypothetical protein
MTIAYYTKSLLKVCVLLHAKYTHTFVLILYAAVVIENHGHAALAGIRQRLQKNYMPTILLIDLDLCPYANQLVHPAISLLQQVVKELKDGTLHDIAPVGKPTYIEKLIPKHPNNSDETRELIISYLCSVFYQ